MLLLRTGKQTLLSALRTAVAVAAQEASPLQWASVEGKKKQTSKKKLSFPS